MFVGSSAIRPQNTGAVRIVHENPCVPLQNLEILAQRRHRPVVGKNAIGHQQGMRRYGAVTPAQPYTVQRCETSYHEEWQERVDGYRVTYLYHGRRQVTEMPNRPGDRIRVRVDVTPAE